MSDEPKQPWIKSLPGILTAATGFIAALSGLVAGLNQLGLFKRTEPPPVQVVASPARDTLRAGVESATVGGSTSSARAPEPVAVPPGAPAPTAGTRVPASRPPAAASAPPSKPAPVPAPGSAPDSAPRTAPSADSTSLVQSRLPKGTVLELTVPARTCAPADGAQRFTARLAAPVKLGGATVLPTNTVAVLRLRRDGAAPAARLDSLLPAGGGTAVSASTIRIRRGAASGQCLKADARLAATLTAPVTLRRR